MDSDRVDSAPPADFVAAGGRALGALGARVGVAYLTGPAVVIALTPPRFPGGQLVALTPLAVAVPALAAACRPRASRQVRAGALAALTLLAVALPACLAETERRVVPLVATWVISSGAASMTLAVSPLVGGAVLVWLDAVAVTVGALAGSPLAVVDLAGPVTTYGVTAVVAVFVRRGFRITETAVVATEAAQVSQQVAQARWAARRRADRVLHDTVLSTLSVLAHGGAGVPADRLRAACRDDAELLRRGLGDGADVQRRAEPTAGGTDDALDTLVRRFAERGLLVRLHRVGSGPPPDPELIDALVPAVRECLGNVARHAGVDAADVVVDSEPTAVNVIVADEGAGFDPAAVPPDRLGLAQSVIGRLAELGGSARVWSTPGQGTSVHLRLPRSAAGPAKAGA